MNKATTPYWIYLEGLLLFSFIPMTLYIMLVLPFGIIMSLLIAIMMIALHRFIARPYLMNHKMHKCFWCNKVSEKMYDYDIEIFQGQSRFNFKACREVCYKELNNFFSFTGAYGGIVKWSILIPLILYFIGTLFLATGYYQWDIKWNKAFFKGMIALSVILISFVYKIPVKSKVLSFPLPIHNLSLLGIRNTVWIFRLVGAWWIYAVIQEVVRH